MFLMINFTVIIGIVKPRTNLIKEGNYSLYNNSVKKNFLNTKHLLVKYVL